LNVEEDKSNAIKKLWHNLFSKLLEELLSPVDIDVFPELPVMSNPPRADVVLLRRKYSKWTAKQRSVLPDGIRDTQASHIVLEFKYSESFNENAIRQAVGYDFFYKHAKQLDDITVQTFVLSARKPQSETLKRLGYETTQQPGVYRTKNPVYSPIILLSLNSLPDKQHNAYIKCFASHMRVKKKAFDTLMHSPLKGATHRLRWFLTGLREFWFTLKGAKMRIELTPEQLTEMGEMWGDSYFSSLTVEERLAGLNPQERLAGLNPQQLDELEKSLKTLKKRQAQ